MKQSRSTSLLKSLVSTATGFGISLAAQAMILPRLLGHAIPFEANIAFALVMTALSVARGYLLERAFEALGRRIRLSPFLQAVIAERQAHFSREGWDDAHDDAHHSGELAQAGAMYALHAGTLSATPPHDWPWSDHWWKPAGFRRDLVKACALVVAEGDRFDRDRKRGRGR